MSNKVVLITGAYCGIGAAVAQAFVREGAKVYGTSRRLDKSDHHAGITMLKLDVRDEDSVRLAVAEVLRAEGRLDVLVNNAGMGIAGPVADMETDELFNQLDTNVLGVHRVLRAAVPALMESRGVIVNISSVAGFVPIPFQSAYSASKYAVESLSECLRAELHPFGVRVVLVEPGDTKTDFTKSRICVNRVSDHYRDRFEASVRRMERDEQNGMPPEAVARVVLRAAGRKNPPVRITVGFSYKALRWIKRFLPDRLILFIIRKLYA
ncbi:MAG: SDR family oxidoreductase [Synergistaceae bacterium]|nr:SDR family oxidoreductase [Synergistaceae bacterium]